MTYVKLNKLLVLVSICLLAFLPFFNSPAKAEGAAIGLDPEKLAEIEKKVEPVLKGKLVTDMEVEDRALLFQAEGLFPDSYNLFFRHGEYLAKEKQDYTQAIPRLKKALELQPKDLPTLEMLAICHSALKQSADEVGCWETLREILDNDDSKEASKIKERVMLGLENMAKENAMVMRQGKRFVVYTPANGDYSQVGEELSDDRLEEIFRQITSDLECIPPYRTSIIALEPTKFDEVKPTSWAGGFARGGKSMILPAEKFPRSDPESILPAKKLLLHEYTHNIIFIAGEGSCPTWLNEGLAVFAERKDDSFTEFKPTIPAPGSILSIDELEKEFMDIRDLSAADGERVMRAYNLAGLYARFLIQNFTMSAPRQIINGLKNGGKFEEVLTQATELNLDTFDSQFKNWLNELTF